jgi:hypothetical protein
MDFCEDAKEFIISASMLIANGHYWNKEEPWQGTFEEILEVNELKKAFERLLTPQAKKCLDCQDQNCGIKDLALLFFGAKLRKSVE